MSEPYLGTVETHEVEEARSILVLLDTSASMIQTGLLKRVVTGFLVPFIAERPEADRLAVARFDSDASGGIFTRNHDGVIMEITRRSVVQQFDVTRDLAMLSTKGTQIGVGLFKALASFVEDEVERRVAEARLDVPAQDGVYRQLQDVLGRFLGYFQSKSKDEFRLEIPLVDTLADVGVGKTMIVVTDGQLLESSSEATRVDYLKILDYYEQLGFRHLYFVSLKSHPAQLKPAARAQPKLAGVHLGPDPRRPGQHLCPDRPRHRHLGARPKRGRHRGHQAAGRALVSARPAAPAAERRSAAAPAHPAFSVTGTRAGRPRSQAATSHHDIRRTGMTVDEAIEIKWQGIQNGDHAPEALQGKLSLHEAYQVQLGVLERYKANGETQAGWKIGLTADAIRQIYSTPDPAFGFLLERNAYAGGHRFSYADIVNPAIESELCFTLGETLRGPGVTREQALNAVSSVAPSFEVVSLQVKMAEDLPLGIADNVSQWGYVTDTAVAPYPKDLVLGDVTAEVKTDGNIIATLLGADVIDDQLQSLAWLANQLAVFGRALEAGQRVITGSFTKPLPIKQGESWETHFSSVGAVSATFE